MLKKICLLLGGLYLATAASKSLSPKVDEAHEALDHELKALLEQCSDLLQRLLALQNKSVASYFPDEVIDIEYHYLQARQLAWALDDERPALKGLARALNHINVFTQNTEARFEAFAMQQKAAQTLARLSAWPLADFGLLLYALTALRISVCDLAAKRNHEALDMATCAMEFLDHAGKITRMSDSLLWAIVLNYPSGEAGQGMPWDRS